MRWRAPSIMRTRPASMSSATTAPSAPTRSAMAVALPPGAAARSAIRSPGSGASTLTMAWLPWSCGVARPSRTAVQATRIADTAHDERVGHQPTGLDLGAGGEELFGQGGDRHLTRIGSQRDRRGFVHGDQRVARRAAPEIAGEALDQPVGVRERDRVVGGLGLRLRQPRERAEVGVHEPARPWRSRADRVDGRRHRCVRRACRGAVGTRRGAARRAPAGRGGAADASPRGRAGRRVDVATAPCRRRARWRRRGRGPTGSTGRASPGATTCAYAPSSTLTSASSATTRAVTCSVTCRSCRHVPRKGVGAHDGRPTRRWRPSSVGPRVAPR